MKRIICLLLTLVIMFISPCYVVAADSSSLVVGSGKNVIAESTTTSSTYLDELTPTNSDRYTGNMGDSFIDNVGTRNSSVDVFGNKYIHGLEAWIARWNGSNEMSWVWAEYDLGGQYNSLTGTISLIEDSYNTSSFDTTIEIIGDDNVIYKNIITPSSEMLYVDIPISGINTLKIYLYDNEYAKGGTSVCLGNFKVSTNYSVAYSYTPILTVYGDESVYYFYDENITWDEANKYCGLRGCHLATITSENENKLLFDAMISNGIESAYFGLTDREVENDWKWCNGETLGYTNWHSGEPNGESSNEDYAMFYWKFTDGTWNDGDFSEGTNQGGHIFICEYDNDSYIYNTHSNNSEVNVYGKLDEIEDTNSAITVLSVVAQNMTTEQKVSSTNIDKVTVLAEEAVSNSATKHIDKEIIHITEPIVKELESSATTTAQALEETLNNNGVKTQRRISKTVKVSTPNSSVVKVKKDTADTTVDTVKIQTSFASVSMDAMDSAEFSLEEKGTNKVAVTFDTDKTTTMKISFPGVTGDTTYMAVVDETGKAIGGKYNPATGELEAKISESGVYSVVYNEKDFEDIKDKSAEMQNAIKTLAAKGIINGTSETTFSPDASISRAEIAALIVRTLSKLDPNEDGGFVDVTKDNWFFGVAGSSRKHGIINGYEDNTFRGNNVILKEQIIAVTARVLRNEMNYKTPENVSEYLTYTDAESLPGWAKEDIALAEMANIVLQRVDGQFVPQDEMTRGDAAIILMRLFNKIW